MAKVMNTYLFDARRICKFGIRIFYVSVPQSPFTAAYMIIVGEIRCLRLALERQAGRQPLPLMDTTVV